MIVVTGIVEVDPENLEAMKGAMAAMEQASRAEPGCGDYTFSVEVNDPSKVRITERWTDKAALAEHFASPHMAAFQEAMGQHPPKQMTITFYEAEETTFP